MSEVRTLTTRPSSTKPGTTTVELPTQPLDTSLPAIRQRVRALAEFAAANGSTISLDELRALMPARRFATDAELEQFLATDDTLSVLVTEVSGEVTIRGEEDLASRRLSQRALAQDRLAKAHDFLETLQRICPWIELAGVSGSTAYGGAKPGDDIDFFLVTTKRRLWISLLLALAAARLWRLRSQEPLVYCFNRIVERADCERAFRESREPLFAREALSLLVLRGEDLYGHLLASARWMETLFPALYARRLGEAVQAFHATRGTRLTPDSILNGAAFLILSPYLWLAGLVRNVRLRQARRDKECFRTVIRAARYATESIVYDELREAYRQAFA